MSQESIPVAQLPSGLHWEKKKSYERIKSKEQREKRDQCCALNRFVLVYVAAVGAWCTIIVLSASTFTYFFKNKSTISTEERVISLATLNIRALRTFSFASLFIGVICNNVKLMWVFLIAHSFALISDVGLSGAAWAVGLDPTMEDTQMVNTKMISQANAQETALVYYILTTLSSFLFHFTVILLAWKYIEYLNEKLQRTKKAPVETDITRQTAIAQPQAQERSSVNVIVFIKSKNDVGVVGHVVQPSEVTKNVNDKGHTPGESHLRTGGVGPQEIDDGAKP